MWLSFVLFHYSLYKVVYITVYYTAFIQLQNGYSPVKGGAEHQREKYVVDPRMQTLTRLNVFEMQIMVK